MTLIQSLITGRLIGVTMDKKNKLIIIPDSVKQLVLEFFINECQGEENKTSRLFLASEFFGAPKPEIPENRDNITFKFDSSKDRRVRETLSNLQNLGHLIGYSDNGGAFLSNKEGDIVPYMNKEYAKYHTLKKKLDAMYHSYKKKYGAKAALKLFDGQGEFDFMDRFDSEGNETIPEPPIERMGE